MVNDRPPFGSSQNTGRVISLLVPGPSRHGAPEKGIGFCLSGTMLAPQCTSGWNLEQKEWLNSFADQNLAFTSDHMAGFHIKNCAKKSDDIYSKFGLPTEVQYVSKPSA